MSLRSRVALLILVLLLAGTLAALVRALQDAQRQVSERLAFTQNLTVELLRLVHGPGGTPGMTELSPEMMLRLSYLQEAGYFDLMVETGEANTDTANFRNAHYDQLPHWFAKLLGVGDNSFVRLIGTYNDKPVLVSTDPGSQLGEIWNNTKATLVSQIGTLLLLNILIYLMVGRWLSPIERIVAGVKEIEKGDYTHRVADARLPELNQIIRNINHLTEVLAASKAENERLQSAAISSQEAERMRLAQELHDSLGQAISAIKAVAVSISIRAREQMPDIADNAKSIEKISENAYKSVRELMSALRPGVLDELGLATALEQMTEDWNHHHETSFCRLVIECPLDDLEAEQTINIYRIVQESLTNVIKHAGASQVGVKLEGKDTVRLSIKDNGIGFDPATGKRGMGLWNIKDRVNLLGGKLEVESRPGAGVLLYIEFPRTYAQGKRAS